MKTPLGRDSPAAIYQCGSATGRGEGLKQLSVWRQARERVLSLLNSPSNAILRRLLTDEGAKHWKGYLFGFAMMGLIALTTSLSAWIIGKIINEVFVGRRLAAVWEITAAIVVIYTVKGLATYGQQVVLSQVGNSIVADVQKRMFDQMLRMKVSLLRPVAFVDIHRPSGLHRPIGDHRAQPSYHDILSRRPDDRRARHRHGVAGSSAFVPGVDVGSARRVRSPQDRRPGAQDHGERVPGRRIR